VHTLKTFMYWHWLPYKVWKHWAIFPLLATGGNIPKCLCCSVCSGAAFPRRSCQGWVLP